MRRTFWWVCAAALGSPAGIGCADPECESGATQVCWCPGGVQGTRTCSAAGAWHPCGCGGGDADADFDADALETSDWTETPVEGDGWTPDDGGDEADVPPPPPCNEITFRYTSASATSVWVTGSFTGWAATPSAGAVPLARDGDVWEAATLIEPHGRHVYKFVIDGSTWIADPDNPEREPDGYGGHNSVLYVCEEECDAAEFDWRDTVMYFVMVDRFFDSDGRADPVTRATDGDAASGPSGQYEGGDLAGVTAKMAYLEGLGVTTLWLSAPYENWNMAGVVIDSSSDPYLYSAYHGYWPSPADISYAAPSSPTPRPRVESRIGTETDLRGVIAAAHAAAGAGGHGIKVLFDYVMNHVDIESGLFAAHDGWFARRSPGGPFALCADGLWEDPYWGTRCAFTDYLPPFDFENAAARAWSVNDAIWWAVEYGLDGYRLDAIKHVPTVWLTDLRARTNATIGSPPGGRFYMVGETFAYDDPGLIGRYVDPATMLDGQFDFPLKARLCEAVFTAGGRLDSLASWMRGNDSSYGADAIMTTWIGNHDIPRAIHFASRQIGNCREGSSPGNSWSSDYRQPADAAPYERLGVAFAVLMTNRGIPLIYYGDEVGLAGGGDPDNRRMMPWNDAALNAHQRALRDRVSALARIRAENPVIGRGRRETISADQDTWVYRLTGCGEDRRVTVAINRSDAERSVDVPAGSYRDLIAGTPVAGGSVPVPARGFLVLGPP